MIVVPAAEREASTEEAAEESNSFPIPPPNDFANAEAAASDEEFQDDFDEDFGDELPQSLPRRPKSKKKARSAKSGKPASNKSRQPAKTKPKAAAHPRRTWMELLTGDIRPLLIGTTLILLGIGFFALPFFAPPFDPETAKNDSQPIVRTSEKIGEGLFLAAYKMFGQAGVIGLCVLVGLLFIGGGIWALKYMEFEED